MNMSKKQQSASGKAETKVDSAEGEERSGEEVQPIVFVNKPISSVKDDAIGFSTQVDTICEAIDNGSTMIGLIADYGSGKSSMTELLCQKVKNDYKKYPKPIKVNMWDSIDKPDKPDSTSSEVTRLTKSFLYQLSKGKDRFGFFSSYINRRLSKNHGNISFSVGSMKFWWLFVASAICYGIYLAASNENLCFAKLFPKASDELISKLNWIPTVSPVFLVLAVFLLIIGVANTCVVFSHWKNQNSRETEMNDVFDLYERIIKRIRPKWARRNGKRIVVIEDLDRIGHKSVIIGFMKELYRFQNVAKKYSDRFAFVVAVKPEDALTQDKQEAGNSERVYSKLFDITVPLKPIHYDDYSAVLLKLINDDEEKKSRLGKLIGREKIDKKTLPQEFGWLIVGENLTVRDIKDRLNHAIMIMMSRKGYSTKNSVKFEACTAVTYLESQYPSDYLKLIKHEQKFAEVMTASVPIIDKSKEETESETIKKLENKFDEVFIAAGVSYSADFKKDLCIMICRGVLDYDFRMYFYTYPAGSHVKTTEERKICDLLRMPNKYSDFSELDEAVATAYKNGNNDAVTEVIRGLSRYPQAILMNKTLIETAGEISWEKVAGATNEFFIEANGQKDDLAVKFWERIREAEFANKELFLRKIIEQIHALPNSERILSIRKQILEVYHGDIGLIPNYKALFFDGEGSYIPIITDAEIKLIDDIGVAIGLIDSNQLTDDEFEYISNLVCSEPLSDELKGKAKEVLSCFIKLSTKGVGEALLKFLKINHLIYDEFFHVCCRECEEEQVVTYVNTLDAKKLSDQYYEDIDEYVCSADLSREMLEGLAERGLYNCILVHAASGKGYQLLDQTRSNVDAIHVSCQWLCDEDKDAFRKIRHHLCAELEDENYFDLYEGTFPLITKDEYVAFGDTSMAIQRINTNLINEENYETVIEIIHEREYTPTEGMLLICRIFDPGNFSNTIFANKVLAADIANEINYGELRIRDLGMKDRETVYTCLATAFVVQGMSIEDQMRKLNCFVESAEGEIAQSKNEDQYYKLISDLDELTATGLKYLSDCYLTIGLSEKLATELRESGDELNYVIANALRKGEMIWEEDISTDTYFDIYCHVEEMYGIMSSHWAFLEAIQKQEYLDKLFKHSDRDKYIKPIFKVPQHSEMFEWMMNDQHTAAEKKEYLDAIKEFASNEDSLRIQRIICREENMELVDSKARYWHIRERFWKPEHKTPYTRAWNKRWETELGKA